MQQIKSITSNSSKAGRRECGGCTACCTVMSVSRLRKPAGSPCAHANGGGCGIYDTRPEPCRGFTCLWLADRNGMLQESHRPDRIGLVLTNLSVRAGDPAIAARELFSGAAESAVAQSLLAHLRRFVPVTVVAAKFTPLTLNGDGPAPAAAFQK